MKIKIILILITLIFTAETAYPCNSCGGGTSDLVVLALDGRALLNMGFLFDHFTGNWDRNGKWIESGYTQNQYKTTLSGAYRLNRHLQFGLSIPYVYNTSNIPGLKESASGLGDVTVSGRYEFFHEFQIRNKAGKSYLDKSLPYLALTFGLTLPTGRSDETAENDVDITGKGFYTTSLGVSITKTLVRNKFQVITDLSWQHSFDKTYDKIYNIELETPYKKSLGDKINYSVAANYIFNNENALAVSASGFTQTEYKINETSGENSSERSLSIAAAYTYYPTLLFRITPSVKYNIPSDNLGRNAPGSTSFNVNFTYYFPDYNIK